MSYTAKDIAAKLNGNCIGDPTVELIKLNSLAAAKAGDLSFLSDDRYLPDLKGTAASVVIVNKHIAELSVTQIVVDDVYASYAKIAQLYDVKYDRPPMRHPTAVIDDTAEVDASVYCGPHVTIAAGAKIAANVILEAGCSVGEQAVIGADTHCYPKVTIYPNVIIGQRVSIQAGTVIGSDGFGFAPTPSGWDKIPQLGSVQIDDDVDIGANTTIDRGALENTHIHRGVIIDNQVQIAHNVVIGERTAIAGCVGIAGSTHIGSDCRIGGGAGIGGHLKICNKVVITGMGMVTRSITEPGMYSSGTGLLASDKWRKAVVRFRQLDRMAKKLMKLEETHHE